MLGNIYKIIKFLWHLHINPEGIKGIQSIIDSALDRFKSKEYLLEEKIDSTEKEELDRLLKGSQKILKAIHYIIGLWANHGKLRAAYKTRSSEPIMYSEILMGMATLLYPEDSKAYKSYQKTANLIKNKSKKPQHQKKINQDFNQLRSECIACFLKSKHFQAIFFKILSCLDSIVAEVFKIKKPAVKPTNEKKYKTEQEQINAKHLWGLNLIYSDKNHREEVVPDLFSILRYGLKEWIFSMNNHHSIQLDPKPLETLFEKTATPVINFLEKLLTHFLTQDNLELLNLVNLFNPEQKENSLLVPNKDNKMLLDALPAIYEGVLTEDHSIRAFYFRVVTFFSQPHSISDILHEFFIKSILNNYQAFIGDMAAQEKLYKEERKWRLLIPEDDALLWYRFIVHLDLNFINPKVLLIFKKTLSDILKDCPYHKIQLLKLLKEIILGKASLLRPHPKTNKKLSTIFSKKLEEKDGPIKEGSIEWILLEFIKCFEKKQPLFAMIQSFAKIAITDIETRKKISKREQFTRDIKHLKKLLSCLDRQLLNPDLSGAFKEIITLMDAYRENFKIIGLMSDFLQGKAVTILSSEKKEALSHFILNQVLKDIPMPNDIKQLIVNLLQFITEKRTFFSAVEYLEKEAQQLKKLDYTIDNDDVKKCIIQLIAHIDLNLLDKKLLEGLMEVFYSAGPHFKFLAEKKCPETIFLKKLESLLNFIKRNVPKRFPEKYITALSKKINDNKAKKLSFIDNLESIILLIKEETNLHVGDRISLILIVSYYLNPYHKKRGNSVSQLISNDIRYILKNRQINDPDSLSQTTITLKRLLAQQVVCSFDYSIQTPAELDQAFKPFNDLFESPQRESSVDQLSAIELKAQDLIKTQCLELIHRKQTSNDNDKKPICYLARDERLQALLDSWLGKNPPTHRKRKKNSKKTFVAPPIPIPPVSAPVPKTVDTASLKAESHKDLDTTTIEEKIPQEPEESKVTQTKQDKKISYEKESVCDNPLDNDPDNDEIETILITNYFSLDLTPEYQAEIEDRPKIIDDYFSLEKLILPSNSTPQHDDDDDRWFKDKRFIRTSNCFSHTPINLLEFASCNENHPLLNPTKSKEDYRKSRKDFGTLFDPPLPSPITIKDTQDIDTPLKPEEKPQTTQHTKASDTLSLSSLLFSIYTMLLYLVEIAYTALKVVVTATVFHSPKKKSMPAEPAKIEMDCYPTTTDTIIKSFDGYNLLQEDREQNFGILIQKTI